MIRRAVVVVSYGLMTFWRLLWVWRWWWSDFSTKGCSYKLQSSGNCNCWQRCRRCGSITREVTAVILVDHSSKKLIRGIVHWVERCHPRNRTSSQAVSVRFGNVLQAHCTTNWYSTSGSRFQCLRLLRGRWQRYFVNRKQEEQRWWCFTTFVRAWWVWPGLEIGLRAEPFHIF